jgi:hypothetical protein
MESRTFVLLPMCSEALISFKKGFFDLLSLSPSLNRETEEVKLIHRDPSLIGDKELSLTLGTLSCFVATLSHPSGPQLIQAAGC